MDKAHAKNMLSIFKRAIPEITSRATLFFVDNNPYIFPGTGEKIKLEKYQVSQPGDIAGSGFEFTIARLFVDSIPPHEVVFVQSFQLPEYPDHKFYVKEHRIYETVEATILYTMRAIYQEDPPAPPYTFYKS